MTVDKGIAKIVRLTFLAHPVVLRFIMLTLFIASMYYITTAYAAGHSLDHRTLTIEYRVLFNDFPCLNNFSPVTVQLTIIDLIIMFLFLVRRL